MERDWRMEFLIFVAAFNGNGKNTGAEDVENIITASSA